MKEDGKPEKTVYRAYIRWVILAMPLILLIREGISFGIILHLIGFVCLFSSIFPDFMTDEEDNLYIRRFISWKRVDWGRIACVYNLVIDRMYFLRNERGRINLLSLFIFQPLFVRKGVQLAQLMDYKLARRQSEKSGGGDTQKNHSGESGYRWNISLFRMSAQKLLLILLAILGAIFVSAVFLANSPRIPAEYSRIAGPIAYLTHILFWGVVYSLGVIWLASKIIEIRRGGRGRTRRPYSR